MLIKHWLLKIHNINIKMVYENESVKIFGFLIGKLPVN